MPILWISVLFMINLLGFGVLGETEYKFSSHCSYKEWPVDKDSTVYVTYDSDTLSSDFCEMGFKSTDGNMETCITTDDFNLFNCQNYVEINGGGEEQKLKCMDSPQDMCAERDDVLRFKFYNGQSNPGGNFKFEVYLDNYDATAIIAISVSLSVVTIGIGIAVFIYCKHFKKKQNRTGTVTNKSSVIRRDGRIYSQNYVFSNRGQSGLTHQNSSTFGHQKAPATQNNNGFGQQGGLTQQYSSTFGQQQAPTSQTSTVQPNNSLFATNSYGNKQSLFAYEQNDSGPVPSAPTYEPPLSKGMY